MATAFSGFENKRRYQFGKFSFRCSLSARIPIRNEERTIAFISGSSKMSEDRFYFRYQVLFPLLTTCEYSLLFRQSGISFLFFCFGVGFYRCMLYYFFYSWLRLAFLPFSYVFSSSIRWHDHLTDSTDRLNNVHHHFRYVTIPNRPVVKANPWSHFFERVDNHTRRCELHNIKKKNEAPKKSYWKNMLASKTVFLTMHPTMTWYL